MELKAQGFREGEPYRFSSLSRVGELHSMSICGICTVAEPLSPSYTTDNHATVVKGITESPRFQLVFER